MHAQRARLARASASASASARAGSWASSLATKRRKSLPNRVTWRSDPTLGSPTKVVPSPSDEDLESNMRRDDKDCSVSEAEMKGEGDGFVVICVKDSGIGIPEEDLERVFNFGERLDNKHRSKADGESSGCGYGLNICRTLVDGMGGAIWVQSMPTKGSSFMFMLPVAPDSDSSASAPAPASPPAPGPAAGFDHHKVQQKPARLAPVQADRSMQDSNSNSGRLRARTLDLRSCPQRSRRLIGHLTAHECSEIPILDLVPEQVADACRGRRVLVVDDNCFNLDVITHFVHQVGCVTTTAQDGAQALQELAWAEEAHGGYGFDAVLMDVQMKVMGGIEATRRMRAHWANLDAGESNLVDEDGQRRASAPPPQKRWRVPIIGLTADTSTGVDAMCTAAGMDAVINKPVGCDLLNKVLASHLLYVAGGSAVEPPAKSAATAADMKCLKSDVKSDQPSTSRVSEPN